MLQLSFLFYLPNRQRIAFKLDVFTLVFFFPLNITNVKDRFYIVQ